jgi:DNA polymerase III delta prime subunit
MKNNVNYGPLPKYIAEDKSEYLDLLRSPLQDYCKEAIKQFGYLDNQGLALDDDDNQGGPVYIDNLYVLPKAGEERISPEMLAQIDDVRKIDNDSENINDVKNKVDQLSSIAELIWKNPRLTLLGDPGVGKTTLMQWLICSLCHWSDNYAKQYLGPMFPLTITARKISEKSIDELNSGELGLANFIDEILSMQGDQLNRLWGKEEKEYLYLLFERGQVLLLVDGLDEISSNTELWLNNKIRDLLLKYSSTHLIMTARVVGFNQFEFWGIAKKLRDKEIHIGISDNPSESGEEFIQASKANQLYLPRIFFLAPFSPEQRKRFSENWVANYLPPNDEKRKDFIDNIDEVSAHSFQLDALSRIPVLLNLICFIQWRRGKLPNGRAELYQRIVETYLVAMDRARLLTHELSDEYDYQDIKNWLGKLAFNMQAGDLKLHEGQLSNYSEEGLEKLRSELPEIQRERMLQISEGDLNEFFQLRLTEVINKSELEKHARIIIDYLKNRTGFLIPRGVVDGEEFFGFSHLSFQEYFCAYYLSNIVDDVSDAKIKDIITTTRKVSWNEILQLFFEEMSLMGKSRTYVEKWLEKFFKLEQDIQIYRRRSLHFRPNMFSLYAKIISNSSIKISSKKRWDRKEMLTKLYIEHPLGSSPVLSNISNEVIKEWKNQNKIFNFKEINLFNEKFNDTKWLMSMPNVSKISLFGMDLESLDFNNLKHGLTSLDVSNCKVSSLDLICDTSQIERLDIVNSSIDDISSLKTARNLTNLRAGADQLGEIYDCISTVNDLFVYHQGGPLSYLSDLKVIKNLELHSENFKKMPKIVSGEFLKSLLIICNKNIYSLEFMVACKSLEIISLYSFGENSKKDKTLKYLDKFSSLKEINIDYDCILDANDLSGCLELGTLRLPSGLIKNPEKLLKLKNLKQVICNDLPNDIVDKLRSNDVTTKSH